MLFKLLSGRAAILSWESLSMKSKSNDISALTRRQFVFNKLEWNFEKKLLSKDINKVWINYKEFIRRRVSFVNIDIFCVKQNITCMYALMFYIYN